MLKCIAVIQISMFSTNTANDSFLILIELNIALINKPLVF